MKSNAKPNQFDTWLNESSPVAALTLRQWLQPVEGKDAAIFPATYARPESWRRDEEWLGYNIDTLADGRNVCQIDSVGSQANRAEPIFKRPQYRALVPHVEIDANGETIDLLDAGHRAADAIVRFSSLWNDLKQAFEFYRKGNAEPLAKLAPTSILFGAWDSRDTQVKLPRIIRAVIRAYDVSPLHRSAQYLPAIDYLKDGVLDATDDDKSLTKAMSDWGLNHAPAPWTHGGIIVHGEIRRDASINLAALRTLGAPNDAVDAALPLRRYILGLALVAFTAPQETSLREGCMLVGDAEKPAQWSIVHHDGRTEPFKLTHDEAIAFCRERRWQSDPARAAAFRWLESLPPPQIIAPQHVLARGCTQFVPNNDSDAGNRQQRTAKTVRPHRLAVASPNEAQTTRLHYVWPIDEADSAAEAHSRKIADAARGLVALGWGIDSAIADVRLLTRAQLGDFIGSDEAKHAVRWRPSPVLRSPDPQRRRAPRPGSLADLERVHESFAASIRGRLYEPRRRPRAFQSVAYLESTAVPLRPYVVFQLLDLDGKSRAFPQQQAIVVAAMMRSLTCQEENRADFAQQFDGIDTEVFLAGHVNGSHTPPRFSYLVLPTVRGEGSTDGMIRRVLIAEPHGGSGDYVQWASQRLANAMLIDKQDRAQGYLAPAESSDAVLRRYVGTARRWTTVTPVILPGYDGVRSVRADDKRPMKAERMLLKCIEQAGIPLESVEHVYMRKAPYWSGSMHPKVYRLPDYLERPHRRPGWHVAIVFRQEVAGPLVVGAGRHCGLGVFAAAG